MLGCTEDVKIFCESTKKLLTCLYIRGGEKLVWYVAKVTISKVSDSSPCYPQKLSRSFGFNTPGYLK